MPRTNKEAFEQHRADIAAASAAWEAKARAADAWEAEARAAPMAVTAASAAPVVATAAEPDPAASAAPMAVTAAEPVPPRVSPHDVLSENEVVLSEKVLGNVLALEQVAAAIAELKKRLKARLRLQQVAERQRQRAADQLAAKQAAALARELAKEVKNNATAAANQVTAILTTFENVIRETEAGLRGSSPDALQHLHDKLPSLARKIQVACAQVHKGRPNMSLCSAVTLASRAYAAVTRLPTCTAEPPDVLGITQQTVAAYRNAEAAKKAAKKAALQAAPEAAAEAAAGDEPESDEEDNRPITQLAQKRPREWPASGSFGGSADSDSSDSDDSTVEFDENGDFISYKGGAHLMYGDLPPEKRPRVKIVDADTTAVLPPLPVAAEADPLMPADFAAMHANDAGGWTYDPTFTPPPGPGSGDEDTPPLPGTQ